VTYVPVLYCPDIFTSTNHQLCLINIPYMFLLFMKWAYDCTFTLCWLNRQNVCSQPMNIGSLKESHNIWCLLCRWTSMTRCGSLYAWHCNNKYDIVLFKLTVIERISSLRNSIVISEKSRRKIFGLLLIILYYNTTMM